MNIEQIADSVSQEMLIHVATIQPELVKWNREFLRRCLSKLAEQDVKPVAYQSTRNGFIAKENKNPEYNMGLYTEAQLIAAQKRTAEACAKFGEEFVTSEGLCDAIRNGDWMEYL